MAAKEKTSTSEQVQEDIKSAEPAKSAEVKVAAKQNESVYTASELAENAKKLFGVRTECVSAALKIAGIKECTVSKAGDTVKAFMKKEVK